MRLSFDNVVYEYKGHILEVMRRKILIGVVAIILLLGGLFVWFLLNQEDQSTIFTPSREDVAADFVDALTSGDSSKAYSLISDNLKARMKSQDYAESKFASLKDGEAVLLSAEVSNDTSYTPEQDAHRHIYRFNFKIDKGSGRYYEVQFIIAKFDGSWKIDYFNGEYVKDV